MGEMWLRWPVLIYLFVISLLMNLCANVFLHAFSLKKMLELFSKKMLELPSNHVTETYNRAETKSMT